MSEITVVQLISAPVEAVWADIAQLETHVEWMADAAHLEFLTETRHGVGTRFRVATRIGPFRTSDLLTITAWDPLREMAVAHEGVFTGRGRFTLEPAPGGTRFQWHETIRFPGYFGGPLVALAARPILAATWRRNLRRLAARFDG